MLMKWRCHIATLAPMTKSTARSCVRAGQTVDKAPATGGRRSVALQMFASTPVTCQWRRTSSLGRAGGGGGGGGHNGENSLACPAFANSSLCPILCCETSARDKNSATRIRRLGLGDYIWILYKRWRTEVSPSLLQDKTPRKIAYDEALTPSTVGHLHCTCVHSLRTASRRREVSSDIDCTPEPRFLATYHGDPDMNILRTASMSAIEPKV